MPRGLALVQLREVAREFGRPDLQEIFEMHIVGELELTGSLLPPTSAFKTLRDALHEIYGASLGGMTRPPLRVTRAYRRVVRAITSAHREIVSEATEGSEQWVQLMSTQVLLEKIANRDRMLSVVDRGEEDKNASK